MKIIFFFFFLIRRILGVYRIFQSFQLFIISPIKIKHWNANEILFFLEENS